MLAIATEATALVLVLLGLHRAFAESVGSVVLAMPWESSARWACELRPRPGRRTPPGAPTADTEQE